MNPDGIGMSGLVIVAISKIRETVFALNKAGISSKIICSSGFKKLIQF